MIGIEIEIFIPVVSDGIKSIDADDIGGIVADDCINIFLLSFHLY
jgi:hypothetical protein